MADDYVAIIEAPAWAKVEVRIDGFTFARRWWLWNKWRARLCYQQFSDEMAKGAVNEATHAARPGDS